MILTVLISLVMLASCGYKLRGAVDLPESMKKINIVGASTSLMTEFRKSIISSEGTIVDSGQEAGLTIKIVKERMDKRVLSLSSRGKSTEFELNYVVIYELQDPGGKLVIPEQTIEIIKDYFNDQRDVVAKSIEEGVIRNEIYRQAVRRIVDKARFELKKVEL